MANVVWTLKYGIVEKTFAAWGLSRPVRRHRSLASSTFTFHQPGAAIDSDPLFAYASTVIIKRNGAQVFYGNVSKITPQVDRGESIAYEISDPYWWLENMTFYQEWKQLSNPIDSTSALVSFFTPHIFLNRYSGANRLTTTQQIAEIVNYAISQGAPLQLGLNMPAIDIVTSEVKNITCAEAIKKELKLFPDVSAWVDGSTTPPTINFRRRSQLAAKTLALTDGKRPRIIPRYDLQVPCVAISYETHNELDGKVFTLGSQDIYPVTATGREFGALTASIDLNGYSRTNAKGSVTCATIATGSADWWVSKRPQLADHAPIKITNLVITNISKTSQAADGTWTGAAQNLPREIVLGQFCPWMGAGGVLYKAEQQQLRCTVNYDMLKTEGGVDVPQGKFTEEISAEITATDAVTGDYQTISSYTQGEAQPLNLAQGIYGGLSVLNYEGQITIKERECSGVISLANTLNLSGGRAEWASIAATVSEITEDLESGETMIAFGPPAHLGIQDLVELLNATRNRITFTAPLSQATGQSASGGSIQLGNQMRSSNTNAGNTVPKVQRFVNGVDDAGAALEAVIDAGLAFSTYGGVRTARPLAIRKMAACRDNGDGTTTDGFVIGLFSVFFTEP